VFSPRRSSGPFRGSAAAVSQTFDRSHPLTLSSAADSQSSANQPPPRFTRRVEPTVVEQQRVTMAAVPTLTPQSIAVVPAAVMPPQPPQAQVAHAEQTNPPPTRYTCSSCSILFAKVRHRR